MKHRAALAALLLTPLFVQSAAAKNVPRPSPAFHRLWSRSISPNADSAAAYAAHVRFAHGKMRPVVFVLAGNNDSNCDPGDPVRKATTYAFDAASGTLLWSRSTSGPSRCTTAGPVVDPSGRWVYAPGLDGKLHRYAAATGKETRNRIWPITVTLMPDVEKMSAMPTIANGYLYVTTSGFIGDAGHYQGHLVTIALKTGHVAVFNTLCSNVRTLLGPDSGKPNYCAEERSGLFGRGQGVTDPVNHDVYIVTGNGAWNGRTDWGDSVLKLDPSGSRLIDAFTPTNQRDLDDQDLDLGSTGPAILPPISSGGRTYHLLVQGGKGPACGSCQGIALRLLNRDDLSGHGGPGHLGGDLVDAQTPGGCEVLTAPAVWKSPNGQNWVFYANDCAIAGYKVVSSAAGRFRLTQGWSVSGHGSTPIISGNTVYVAHDGAVEAYDAGSGRLIARDTSIGSVHWEYPLVAGNRLFMTDQSGHVFAFTRP